VRTNRSEKSNSFCSIRVRYLLSILCHPEDGGSTFLSNVSERPWRDILDQWYSTWGTRTPGGTRRHLRGYVKFKKNYNNIIIYLLFNSRPPLWSSGQSFWLLILRSWVRFPALPNFLRGSGSGTGSTQPREYW
jgi:hypothetical protein